MSCVSDGVWEISEGRALDGDLHGPSGAAAAMVESFSVLLGKTVPEVSGLEREARSDG